ncbi:hypothetical protein HZ994_11225 [Akkermansiaceae bacterium]|nr:hypothetical protein HZ994_11225 [Akkermansiaceae bacterium]
MAAPKTRIAAAIILSLIGVAGSTGLIVSGLIGELSFVLLLVSSAFIGLVVAFIDRIQSFSLRELKVEMAKVEAARQEVEDIAMTLAEISVFFAAFNHRFGSEESHRIEREWITTKVHNLLDSIQQDTATKEKVLRYLTDVQKMDAMRESDSEAGDAIWDAMWKTIEDESKKRR